MTSTVLFVMGLLILPVCESPQVDWTGESLKYTCFIFWESKISTDESDVQLDPPAEKKTSKKKSSWLAGMSQVNIYI